VTVLLIFFPEHPVLIFNFQFAICNSILSKKWDFLYYIFTIGLLSLIFTVPKPAQDIFPILPFMLSPACYHTMAIPWISSSDRFLTSFALKGFRWISRNPVCLFGHLQYLSSLYPW